MGLRICMYAIHGTRVGWRICMYTVHGTRVGLCICTYTMHGTRVVQKSMCVYSAYNGCGV